MTLYQINSISKLRNYLFSKHHVTPWSRGTSLREVGNNLVGIHSARLSTPYVALQTRVSKFTPTLLRTLVYGTREALKIRCMRGTLHIVPNDLAPILHIATLPSRLRVVDGLWLKTGISKRERLSLISSVVDAVSDSSLTSSQILAVINSPISRLKKDDSIAVLGGRLAIKEAWERGLLCYLNKSDHWAKERRHYGSTLVFYPNLNLNKLSFDDAVGDLIYAHICRYGPVTVEDIAWWSGLGIFHVRNALHHLSSEIEKVVLPGFDCDCYMASRDVEEIKGFSSAHDDWLELLAYEDPSLKGYFKLREIYADQRIRGHLFNKIGEARASIILNGQIVGIWKWNSGQGHIDVELLVAITLKQHTQLDDRVHAMTTFLRLDTSNVSVPLSTSI